MNIRLDDLRGLEISALLHDHLNEMHATSPRESVHALDLDGLRNPEISFWTIWEDVRLAGCGALKELNSGHGEIKSMRTAAEFRRRGVAKTMLKHLLAEAKRRQYQRVSLETGSMAFFDPARKLYTSFGFQSCAPFADYRDDPNSVFMTMEI